MDARGGVTHWCVVSVELTVDQQFSGRADCIGQDSPGRRRRGELNPRAVRRRRFVETCKNWWLINAHRNLYIHAHVYRLAVEQSGFEAPRRPYGLHSRLIESISQPA